MPSQAFKAPPHWTEDELRAQRDEREMAFRQQWRREGPEAVASICEELFPAVTELLERTDYLRSLDGGVFRDDPSVWQLLRYVCAPVLSEENFWTLVGSPKSKIVRDAYADDSAEVINLVIDPVRFPWISEGRHPSETERNAAVLATVVLLAAQRVGTSARRQTSRRQEAAVASALSSCGYELDESRDKIMIVDGLERGKYSKERILGNAKCDVPLRLRDGRLLAIECKVSIGPKNGWKRINRETGGKAEAWRTHFGAAQVITAVVMDGVFDLGCLRQAQNQQGVVLFWEHHLEELASFISEAE
jgi:XamI restriction endonuclease